MAVAENAPNFDDTALSGSHAPSDFENPKPRIDSSGILSGDPIFQSNGSDQNNQSRFQNQENTAVSNTFSVSPSNHNGRMQNGFDSTVVTTQQMVVMKSAGYGIDHNYNGIRNGDDGGEDFKRDMRDLEELLSKLNPMAEEFVPPSLAKNHGCLVGTDFGYMSNLIFHDGSGNVIEFAGRRKKNDYTQGRKRNYQKMSPAQRESMIRRTVYVSDIDQQVTEENLAALFLNCGQVVDCRVCGDPNSILRFAFVEFTDEEGARTALNLSGTMLGYYPVKVLPSKTAIAPVNPTFLPRSNDEREMCSRTIYCTNIDKKVAQAEVKLFFETLCGEVQRLRLLGDYHHSTRIAFVEFTLAESAIAALNCSGVVLGSLPIRVSPSKTPVRPRTPRSPLH